MDTGHDYLQIRPEDSSTWADYWLIPTDDGYETQGFIYGPGEGDKIMSHVVAELQKQASERSQPIRHCFVAGNNRSLKLIQRTAGYTYVGKTQNGHPMYECVYR